MKKLLLPLLSLLLVAGTCTGQSKDYRRFDSTYFQKDDGGNAEIILRNGTRNVNGGFLQNRYGGRTRFAHALDSFYYSGDTTIIHRTDGALLKILSGGPGGATYTFLPPFLNAGGTVSLPGWNAGQWDEVYTWYNGDPLAPYYTGSQVDQIFAGVLSRSGYNKANWDAAYEASVNGVPANTYTKEQVDSAIAASGNTGGLSFINGLEKIGNNVVSHYDQAIWNANKIQGLYIDATAPLDGQVLAYDGPNGQLRWVDQAAPADPGSGSGGTLQDAISAGAVLTTDNDISMVNHTLYLRNGDGANKDRRLSLGLDYLSLHSQDDGNNYQDLSVGSGSAVISAWSGDLGKTSAVNVQPNQVVIGSTDFAGGGIGSGIFVQPNQIMVTVASGGNQYLPISVNGNYADASGNISITTGGSTPSLEAVLAAGNTVTNHDFIMSGAGGLHIEGFGYPTGGNLSTLVFGNSSAPAGDVWQFFAGINGALVVSDAASPGGGFQIYHDGMWILNTYGTGSHAGTQKYDLQVDVDGQLIERKANTLTGLGTYASDAAAGSAGLTAGTIYKDSSGNLHIKL